MQQKYYRKIVKVLTQQPTINLNVQNKQGYTPFYYAIDKGEEMMNVMLSSGKVKIDKLKEFRDYAKNEDGNEYWLQIHIKPLH